MQHYTINIPIIIVGAAGLLQQQIAWPLNSISMIIGKHDIYHYEHAINFFRQLKNAEVPATLIERDGGHIIPKNLVKMRLQELL